MARSKSVPATTVISMIGRLRATNKLEEFIRECEQKGYRVTVPSELYDLATSTANSGVDEPTGLSGSGVCEP